MPSLQILKTASGANDGTTIELKEDRCVLGRNPECRIVIPANAVSREHAQIVRKQGRFFLEDLGSRNKTWLNDQELPPNSPTVLRHNDRIRICDFLAQYVDGKAEDIDEEEVPQEPPVVEATIQHGSSLQVLEAQPAEKLRGLLEISANLSRTLELDALLPKIVDSLFQLFRQADRCFIILNDADNNRLIPKVIKTRRPQDETTARFSRTIVRQCMETAQAFLSDDASQDNRVMGQSVVDFRIRSVMCVPLVNVEGKAVGVVQLDTQDRMKKFTRQDLELLCGVANQASVALENARMYKDAVAQELIKRDLKLAAEVQRSFLPEKLPIVSGYEFWAVFRPANMVGGDYYDFIPLAGQKQAMVLGDVAGKGVPASLLMAKLSAEARYCFSARDDSSFVVSQLNDVLSPQLTRMERFITLSAAVLDPATHVVTLVNAGHPSPLLYRKATDTFEECVSRKLTGFALGVVEGYAYDACQISLEPGDALLIYSDGVTDANTLEEVSFNLEGILTALKSPGHRTSRGLVERLLRAVDQHALGAKQIDDITITALGRIA